MKKGFLSVLLTLGMVLIMLPTTAYADSTWCDTCNKRVTVRYEYEYKDAQWHWNHTYCLECGRILRIHALNISGAEQQLAQAEGFAQFAAEHLTHSDMLTKAL